MSQPDASEFSTRAGMETSQNCGDKKSYLNEVFSFTAVTLEESVHSAWEERAATVQTMFSSCGSHSVHMHTRVRVHAWRRQCSCYCPPLLSTHRIRVRLNSTLAQGNLGMFLNLVK